jgi:hypothetical protein
MLRMEVDTKGTRKAISTRVYDRRGGFKKLPPGRPVGVIARQPKGHKKGDYNPLVLFFTVNPYRKDYDDVVDQGEYKGKLTGYTASLFHSCFKDW